MTVSFRRFLYRNSYAGASISRHRWELAESLRWVSVYNVNLAVARERISDKHWIYFPGTGTRSIGLGFPMNFSASMGQPGCSSLYVEISHQPTGGSPDASLIERVRRGVGAGRCVAPRRMTS